MIGHDVSAKQFLRFVSSSKILDIALDQARTLDLKDWRIVGGAVRDVVWSLLEDRDPTKIINDIDLIYFDPSDCSRARDYNIEASLTPVCGLPWSVKNQARMHLKSNDSKYTSAQEATWCAPETISTVSVCRTRNANWIVDCSFGYEDILAKTFRPTPHFVDRNLFKNYVARVHSKGWLDRWPSARILPW